MLPSILLRAAAYHLAGPNPTALDLQGGPWTQVGEHPSLLATQSVSKVLSPFCHSFHVGEGGTATWRFCRQINPGNLQPCVATAGNPCSVADVLLNADRNPLAPAIDLTNGVVSINPDSDDNRQRLLFRSETASPFDRVVALDTFAFFWGPESCLSFPYSAPCLSFLQCFISAPNLPRQRGETQAFFPSEVGQASKDYYCCELHTALGGGQAEARTECVFVPELALGDPSQARLIGDSIVQARCQFDNALWSRCSRRAVYTAASVSGPDFTCNIQCRWPCRNIGRLAGCADTSSCLSNAQDVACLQDLRTDAAVTPEVCVDAAETAIGFRSSPVADSIDERQKCRLGDVGCQHILCRCTEGCPRSHLCSFRGTAYENADTLHCAPDPGFAGKSAQFYATSTCRLGQELPN